MGKCSDGRFGEADFHVFFMVFLSFPSVLRGFPWFSKNLALSRNGYQIEPHHGKF